MCKIVKIFCISLLSGAFASSNSFGGAGPLRTWSAETAGHLKASFGLSGRGSPDEAKIASKRFLHHYEDTQSVDSNGTEIDEVLDISFRLFVSLGYTEYADFGIMLPIHADSYRKAQTEIHPDLENIDGVGLGDLEIWGKLQYPPYEHSHIFDMAFLGMLSFPTGAKETGFVPKESFYVPVENSKNTKFFSAGAVTAKVMMLWTLNFDEWLRAPFKWHVNYGLHTTFSDDLGNSFLLNSAVVYTPSPIFDIFLDFSGQSRLTRFEDGFDLGRDPLYLSPGFKVNSPDGGISFTVAFDKGLSTSSQEGISDLRIDADKSDGTYTTYRTIPTPNWGFAASLSWSGFIRTLDEDNDKIPDNEDACPKHPEDYDGFEDIDGCPDPDNDLDEVDDSEDQCPTAREDIDGFEDEDGCPDLDNDQDKIPDLKDKCPLQPEEYNGFRDNDGCPESGVDTDKDGIDDLKDLCVGDAEDKDDFEDEDGCPEEDNDKDGIKDEWDRCPNQPETINNLDDEDGCPDTEKLIDGLVVGQSTMLFGVNFMDNSAVLPPASYNQLKPILAVLKQDPSRQFEFRTNVSKTGDDALDLKLSRERGSTLKEFFVEEGVVLRQLKFLGLGSGAPVATNQSEEGRKLNNRVEVYRAK